MVMTVVYYVCLFNDCLTDLSLNNQIKLFYSKRSPSGIIQEIRLLFAVLVIFSTDDDFKSKTFSYVIILLILNKTFKPFFNNYIFMYFYHFLIKVGVIIIQLLRTQ